MKLFKQEVDAKSTRVTLVKKKYFVKIFKYFEFTYQIVKIKF